MAKKVVYKCDLGGCENHDVPVEVEIAADAKAYDVLTKKCNACDRTMSAQVVVSE